MAKQAPAPKQRWYKTLVQAYKITAKADKALPWLMALVAGIPIALGVASAFVVSGYFAKIFGPVLGLMTGMILGLLVLTRRFEKQMFKQMDGQLGGSLAVAQSIRRGWQFADEPIAVEARSRAVVFQGVGQGGVVLLAEGGRSAKKTVDQTTARLGKLVPGVPVTTLYVGNNEGEVRLKDLTKAIRGIKRREFGRGLGKGLSGADQDAVRARLRALGGPQMPIPKGVDPARARADRKALRGR